MPLDSVSSSSGVYSGAGSEGSRSLTVKFAVVFAVNLIIVLVDAPGQCKQ